MYFMELSPQVLYKAYADMMGAGPIDGHIKNVVAHEKKAEELRSWQQFMSIMLHLKKKKMQPTRIAEEVEGCMGYMTKRLITKLKGSNMEKAKFGDWVEEWSEVANRNVYTNTVTNECRWAMPDEVRFYLPPKMEDKLLQVFDYGHIETFKKQFSQVCICIEVSPSFVPRTVPHVAFDSTFLCSIQVDVDSSGDISDVEIKMLFDAMGVR